MKNYIKLLFMASIIAAMCFAFAACGDDTEDEDYGEDEYHYLVEDMEAGTDIGSFTATDLDGNEVTESIFADKDVTVLNVWATYCDPCKEEMPDLGAWDKELPDNAQIVGIVIDVPEGDAEMIDTAKAICEDTGVKYKNIVYTDSVDKMLADVEAVPTTFILDSEGKTICTPVIGNDVEAYKKAVQEYLDQLE